MKRSISGFLLPLKVSLTILPVVIFLTFLLTISTSFKYSSMLFSIVGSRFSVMTEDLLHTLSHGLNLGLSLSELHATQGVIESIRKHEPLILSLSVFEFTSPKTGKILYSTQQSQVARNVPSCFIEKANEENADQKFWHIDEASVGVVGATIYNDFKKPMGGILMHFDRRPLNHKVFDFLRSISLYSFCIILIVFLLISIFIRAIFRSLTQSFSNMHGAIQSVLQNKQFIPFISSNIIEENFYRMYKSTKALFIKLETLERHAILDTEDEKPE